ncbi:H-NS histone family protein [Mesorhizobium sp.]|uniref:H-NS histone family protein n=1 Tax=Mesorhizobium sp. TaxID=1871066 RepID=UPI0025C6F0AA|nr:H-NS histone family protein [Mesorhizobium sp.]
MSDQATGEAPVALTPRLIFSASVDDIVPTFLRKERDKNYQAPEQQQTSAIVEPEAPASVVENVNEAPAAVETAELVEAPTSDNEPVVFAEETSADHDGVDGDGQHGAPDNLDDMSVEQLKQQQEEIDRKIKERQQQEKQAVIDQIVNVVNTYNIPIEELVDALGGMKIKRKGVKAKPKYQGPNGEIWSGRGKEPAWIRGKKRDPFLIK